MFSYLFTHFHRVNTFECFKIIWPLLTTWTIFVVCVYFVSVYESLHISFKGQDAASVKRKRTRTYGEAEKGAMIRAILLKGEK